MAKIHLIVLAAGRGERFGGAKLSTMLAGRPLLAHCLTGLAPAASGRKLVILGETSADLNDICHDAGFQPIQHPGSREGMGSSLARGARELLADDAKVDAADLVAVALADMPLVKAELLQQLATALTATNCTVVKPVYQGRGGHPVLFRSCWLPELARLGGDRGARDLLRTSDRLLRLAVEDEAILLDIDRPDDLPRVLARLNSAVSSDRRKEES